MHQVFFYILFTQNSMWLMELNSMHHFIVLVLKLVLFFFLGDCGFLWFLLYKWNGCWCLFLVTKNFYLFGKTALLWTNKFKTSVIHCKYSIVQKKISPFIWIDSVNWILSRHHFCWWNKDIPICIVAMFLAPEFNVVRKKLKTASSQGQLLAVI